MGGFIIIIFWHNFYLSDRLKISYTKNGNKYIGIIMKKRSNKLKNSSKDCKMSWVYRFFLSRTRKEIRRAEWDLFYWKEWYWFKVCSIKQWDCQVMKNSIRGSFWPLAISISYVKISFSDSPIVITIICRCSVIRLREDRPSACNYIRAQNMYW